MPGTVGYHLSTVGQERGTVTGRACRCGWLDAAAPKRSVLINGIRVCASPLDVLDGLSEIKVCTGYMLRGDRIDILPLDADDIAACEPIYESSRLGGHFRYHRVGQTARQCARLSGACRFIGAPIDMVSTALIEITPSCCVTPTRVEPPF